ncbi:hypothetical protein O1M54_01830 [Streptomyces diastatochromogenes]|nr:hypothetical protein [Streptomyces diastatochromogenes]
MNATSIACDEGLGPVVRPLLHGLADQVRDLEHLGAHRLANSTVDLVGALLVQHGSVPGLDDDGREVLRRRIFAYMEQRLADPGLGPDQIAAAHHISRRYLYKLLAEQGHTVSGWIRERRLAECRRDLTDPALAHLLVAHGPDRELPFVGVGVVVGAVAGQESGFVSTLAESVEDLQAVVRRAMAGLVESRAEDEGGEDIGVRRAVVEEYGVVFGVSGHDEMGVVAEEVLLLERGLLLADRGLCLALLGGCWGGAHGVGDGRVGVPVVAFAYVPAGVRVCGQLRPVCTAATGERADRCGVNAQGHLRQFAQQAVE